MSILHTEFNYLVDFSIFVILDAIIRIFVLLIFIVHLLLSIEFIVFIVFFIFFNILYQQYNFRAHKWKHGTTLLISIWSLLQEIHIFSHYKTELIERLIEIRKRRKITNNNNNNWNIHWKFFFTYNYSNNGVWNNW